MWYNTTVIRTQAKDLAPMCGQPPYDRNRLQRYEENAVIVDMKNRNLTQERAGQIALALLSLEISCPKEKITDADIEKISNYWSRRLLVSKDVIMRLLGLHIIPLVAKCGSRIKTTPGLYDAINQSESFDQNDLAVKTYVARKIDCGWTILPRSTMQDLNEQLDWIQVCYGVSVTYEDLVEFHLITLEALLNKSLDFARSGKIKEISIEPVNPANKK